MYKYNFFKKKYFYKKKKKKDNDSSCCNVSLEKPISSTNLQCFEHHEALLDLYEVYLNEKTYSIERKGPYIPIPPISSKCSNFINIMKNSKKCYVDSDCNASKNNKEIRNSLEFLNINYTNDLDSKLNYKRQEPVEIEEYEDLSEKEYLKNIHIYDTNLDSYCMTPYIPNPFMRVIKFQISDYLKNHDPHYREIIFLIDPREVLDSGK